MTCSLDDPGSVLRFLMATKEDSSPEKASSTLDFGMLEDHLLQSSLVGNRPWGRMACKQYDGASIVEEEWPLFGNC